MNSVTCVVHGGEVDVSDIVELPNGPVCTRCYEWMEGLLDDDEDDSDEFSIFIIEGDDDDD